MAFLDMWHDWLWFAGAALGLATALTAVVYMLSELLQNDRMKGWAKLELSEIFYSALIIALALVALPTIDAVVQGALGVSNTGGTSGGNPGPLGSITSAWIRTQDTGSFTASQQYQALDICGAPIAANPRSVYNGIESCHIKLGIWFLRELFDEGKSYAFNIYLDYIKTSMISEFTINIEFLFEQAGFFTFTPWKGFFTMGNKIKELVFDWCIKLLMLLKFQEVTLRFIATALFPALFIIGVMLRTFSFTRKIGGLLLAMAIALYFVFPAFYAFGALIMLDLKNDPSIRAAWMANHDANPNGLPDPSIAATMYLRGDTVIPMVGGNNSYSAEDVRSNLSAFEGMDYQTYMRNFESGSVNGNRALPQFDLNSRAHANASAADINNTLTQQRQVADSWFGNVSRMNMFDNFVSFAWMPNGPIDGLSRLTFWSVFFSLISIIATIAAIRSLSITFGGDIEIAGLTRLI
ncbi:MAG: hypothetical protein U0R44_03690 [Candidatus Micrarchaeia archaeon]